MSFWQTFVLVALGMGVADALWTVYVTKATEGRALAAGTAATGIVFVNSYVVFEYVHDRRLVFAAALGSFFGTVAPLLWARRRRHTT